MIYIGYLMMIFISIVFLLGGTVFLQTNLYRIRNWTKTQAVVIEHEEGFDESASVYGEVIKFKIKNRDVISKSNTQSSFPRKIGKQLIILYDPDDPKTFIRYSVPILYVAPCLILMTGAISFGITLYFLLADN